MKKKNPSADIYNWLSHSYPQRRSLLQLWYKFLACHVYSTRSISRHLKASCNISLPGYDVMSVLAQYPDGIQMTQLAKLLLVGNSNITGIVHRLELSGYIVRIVTSDDKRGRLVKFTRKGKLFWKKVNRAYEGYILQLLSHIEPAQRTGIAEHLIILQQSITRESRAGTA